VEKEYREDAEEIAKISLDDNITAASASHCAHDVSMTTEDKVDETVVETNHVDARDNSLLLVPLPPVDPCSSSSPLGISHLHNLPNWAITYIALHEQLASTYTGTDEAVRIPETVVFKENLPVSWYCTPADSIGVFRCVLYVLLKH
jgi:hypothetical protein